VTPEFEAVIAWYRACYEPVIDAMTGLTTWRRSALPAAGGVGDQESWLIDALDVVADEHRALAVTALRRETRAMRVRDRTRRDRRHGR